MCHICVISGLVLIVAENCSLMGYYIVGSGKFLPTFQDDLSVPSSGCMSHASKFKGGHPVVHV
jgi:hypothetical protein